MRCEQSIRDEYVKLQIGSDQQLTLIAGCSDPPPFPHGAGRERRPATRS